MPTPATLTSGDARIDRRTTVSAALTALGIVYGDLGTSPLYTLQTITQICGGKISPATLLGILSLIVGADSYDLDQVLRLRHACRQ